MRTRAFILSVALVLAAGVVPAQEVQIKLGSIVPVGSAWDLALKRLAAEWQTVSRGQVKLVIYSGGTVGDEPSVIRKLKLGQLQAAGLTARGLSTLYQPVLALSLPMLTRNDGELDYVLKEMQTELEAGIESGGVKVLFWIRLGWVYFYSRNPVIVPEDLKKQKLWVWTESPEEATVWKSLNFHIVQLPTTDMLVGLQSGMLDTFATTPLFAAARQWFALAPNMADLKWAPLFGALVVKLATWNKIPADLQAQLLAIARRVGDEVRVQTVEADQEAIEVMKRYGLKINHVSDTTAVQWTRLADEGFSRLIGTVVDAKTTDRVRALLELYRRGVAR